MTAAILLTILFFHTPTSEFWNFFNLRCAPASGYVQIIYANLCTKLQLRARRGVVILQAPQVWVTSGQQIVLVLLDDAYLRRRNYHGEYSQDNWDVISRNFRYWICYLLFFLDDLQTCLVDVMPFTPNESHKHLPGMPVTLPSDGCHASPFRGRCWWWDVPALLRPSRTCTSSDRPSRRMKRYACNCSCFLWVSGYFDIVNGLFWFWW